MSGVVVVKQGQPYGGPRAAVHPQDRPGMRLLWRARAGVSRGESHEASLSAQYTKKAQEARLSGADEHAWRACRAARPAPQGAKPTGRVSGSASSRNVSDGSRAVTARRGPLRVSHRAVPGASRVLFVVPKSVGNAVVRNRARRRVRGAIHELVRDRAVVLADGEYRFGVFSPLEALSSKELRRTLGSLLRDVQR